MGRWRSQRRRGGRARRPHVGGLARRRHARTRGPPPAPLASSVASAAHDELAAEQRHLDRTWSVFERLLRALARGKTGVDEFADEALERMRAERVRVYTSAGGPLYFGRIDRGRRRRALHRPPRDRRRAQRAAGHQLARAGGGAVLRRHARRATTASRGAGAWTSRTGACRLRRRDAPSADASHLTDAIIEDITRQRVGEMRQIISTITPEQYELITGPSRARWSSRAARAPARRRSACTAPPGCCTPTRPGPPGRARRRPQRRLHRVHRPGAAGAGRDHRRAAVGRRAGRRARPARRRGRRTSATLKGAARWPACCAACCGRGSRVPEDATAFDVGRRAVAVAPGDLRRLIATAREQSRSYQGARERFRDALAGLVAARLRAARSRWPPPRASS